MAVIRVQKTQNYTVMSNHHLRNRELSLKAKGLMSLMLSLPPDWDYSVTGLVSICKESHTAVRGALKELEENNYLVRRRTNSEKGYFVYEYTLYEIPDLRHAENVYADESYAEERPQLNKDKLNTKELNKDNNLYIGDYSEILEEIVDRELKNLYVDYIEMRRNINAQISKRGLAMLINRCERLSNFDIELQKALLEAAIINEWKNVYLPNEQDIQNNTTLASLKRKYSR